jgi:hypothetical protein
MKTYHKTTGGRSMTETEAAEIQGLKEEAGGWKVAHDMCEERRLAVQVRADWLEAENKRLREGISGLAEITSGEIHEELEALLTDPSPAQPEAAD